MKHLFKIWLIFLAAVVSGCSKDIPCTDALSEKPSEGLAYVSIKMNVAGTQGESPTLGTDKENAVRTVDLLVYDYDAQSGRSGRLIDIVSIDEDKTASLLDGTGVTVPVYTESGNQIQIYAAVNLTPRMRRSFSLGQYGTDIPFTSGGTADDYSKIMDEFVPGSQGRHNQLEKYAAGCIPMTGQFKSVTDGEAVITVTDKMKDKANAWPIKAEVSRVVAKVLVTAKTETHPLSNGNSVDYVFAKERSAGQEAQPANTGSTTEYSGWMGWIRLIGVRYTPNGINKSAYLIQEQPGKDPNMSLTDYILSGSGRELKFDSAKQEKDFLYYDNVSLHRWNINTPITPKVDEYMTGLEVAEKYDEVKLNSTLTIRDYNNRYVEGMYCPENYFDLPQDGSAFVGYEDALPMVTHVTIAAKLTPRSIVVVSDFKQKMDQLVTDYGQLSDEKFKEKYKTAREEFSKDINKWNTGETNSRLDRYFTDDVNYPPVYYPNESFRLIKVDSEQDATDILDFSMKSNGLWSSNKNEFEQDKFPTGTYFSLDLENIPSNSAETGYVPNQRYLFLSAGAVASARGKDFYLKSYSVPHIGGWGYYYTYIEPGGTEQTAAGYAASQVTRNTYYILTINNFGSPGGLGTSPEYIKVNTEAVGWDYEGRGDIKLN